MDKWLIKNSTSTAKEVEPSTSNARDSKRRKVVRKYDPGYLAFGFTWNGDEDNPKPECIICNEVLANESMRPSKLRRHMETKHSDLKNQPMKYFKRRLDSLKVSKSKLVHFTKVNEKALLASYVISHRIAKTGKPHTIGETLVLPAIKDTVKVMFDEKSLREIESIPLSNSTVGRRIDEMALWAEQQLVQRVVESKFFSLQLDESTDVQGLSQLLVFVRYIWNNEPNEEMLFCEPIIRGTSEEIFKTLDTYVKSKNIDWKKCVGICTDGARAMCGKKSSVVTKVLSVSPNASWTHCNIHREALVSKKMLDNIKSVLNDAVKIVNSIKAKPLQSRLFEKLCEEMGSHHKSLLLHTEVRWLSRGRVLTRLVELRDEVAIFLGDEGLGKLLHDVEFVLNLTYLADIFSKLNELNTYLQGMMGEKDIFEVHDKIRGFMRKLELWKKNIECKRYDSFETFQTFVIENNINVSDNVNTMITNHLSTLKESFNYYFIDDMKHCEGYFWIVNPFQDNITRTGISTKADEELIDLSENSSLKHSFNRSKLIQFWLSVETDFPVLSTEALKILLPFTSSYNCEVGFSSMSGIKSKNRNKLQLSNSLRIKITQVDLDFNAIIDSNRKQAHPSHGSC